MAVHAGEVVPWSLARAGRPASLGIFFTALVLAGATLLDVLDGAIARGAGLQSKFGAILDSTLDRISDVAIFAGCGLHYASSGNVTMVAVAFAAATHAYSISYVKARAENLVAGCGVGFWQRPERCGTFICAAAMGQLPAGLWLLATLPLFTVVARLRRARALCEGRDHTARPYPWQGRRGSAVYVCVALAVLTYLAAGPTLHPVLTGMSDPLGMLLARFISK